MAQPAEALAAQTNPASQLIERALSRAGGTPLIEGNAIELLIDARQNFDRWLAAIRGAQRSILFENYIFSNDDIGREFRTAFVEAAQRGVKVLVIYDWLGCLGSSRASFWKPLLDAG